MYFLIEISDMIFVPIGWAAFFTSGLGFSSAEGVCEAGISAFLGVDSRGFSPLRSSGASIKNFFFYLHPPR